MLLVTDLAPNSIQELLRGYALSVQWVADGEAINGSFWGEPEAGILDDRLFIRSDTPVHSLLHETCHVVCMTPARRKELCGDAGGDDLEECAVCYLQIVLADELRGASSVMLMQDMDDWGYSFRLGSTKNWFESDADDARAWLERHKLISVSGRPTYDLRRA